MAVSRAQPTSSCVASLPFSLLVALSGPFSSSPGPKEHRLASSSLSQSHSATDTKQAQSLWSRLRTCVCCRAVPVDSAQISRASACGMRELLHFGSTIGQLWGLLHDMGPCFISSVTFLCMCHCGLEIWTQHSNPISSPSMAHYRSPVLHP